MSEEVTNMTENNGQKQGSKSPKGWIILAVVAVFVIVGVVYAVTTGLGTVSAETKFSKAFESFDTQVGDLFDGALKETTKISESYLDRSYAGYSNVRAEINSFEGMTEEEIAAMNENLKNTILSFDTRYDKTGIIYLGANIVNGPENINPLGSIFLSKDILAMDIPSLHEKTLTIKKSEVEGKAEYMDLATMFESIEDISGEVEKVTFTDKEIEKLEKLFTKTITENVKKEDYKLEKDVTYKEERVEKITLDISPEQLMKMVKTFLTSMKEDEELQKIIYDKVLVYSGISVTKEEFLEIIDDMLEEIESTDYSEMFKEFKIVVYQNNSKMRAFEVILIDEYTEIRFEMGIKDNKLTAGLTIKEGGETTGINLEIARNKGAKDEIDGKLVISDSSTSLEMRVLVSEEKKDSQLENDVLFEITMPNVIQGGIVAKSVYEIEENRLKSDDSIQIKIDAMGSKYEGTITADSVVSATEVVQIDTPNEENSVSLLDGVIMNQVIENISKLLGIEEVQ